MRAVDSQIGADGSSELSIARSCYRVESAPEQTVMHEQQINILSYCKLDRHFTRVHSGADFCHATVVFQLQTIDRIRVIFDFPDLQKIVEKVTNGAEHRQRKPYRCAATLLRLSAGDLDRS